MVLGFMVQPNKSPQLGYYKPEAVQNQTLPKLTRKSSSQQMREDLQIRQIESRRNKPELNISGQKGVKLN